MSQVAARPALRNAGVAIAVKLGIIVFVFGVLGCGTSLGFLTGERDGPMVSFLCSLACLAVSAPLLGVALGLFLRRKLTRPLDAAFAALDPNPRRYMLSGRAWVGEHRGRHVQIAMVRGPSLLLTVAADARTRLGIGWRNRLSLALARGTDMEEIPLDGVADAEDLAIFALDGPWARDLIARPGVLDALVRIGGNDGLSVIRAATIEPDCIFLNLRRLKFAPHPEEFATLLDDMVDVAEAVEAAALPTVTREASRLVTQFRPEPLRVVPRS